MFLFEALNKILQPKKVEVPQEEAPKAQPVYNNDSYKKQDYPKSSSKWADKPYKSNKPGNFQNKTSNYKSNDFPPKKKWEDRSGASPSQDGFKSESKFKKDDSRAYVCYINSYNQVTYILNKEKITAFIDGMDEYVSEQGESASFKATIKNYLFSTVSKKNVFVEVTSSDPLTVKIFLDEQKTDLLLDGVKSLNQTIQVQRSSAPSFKFNN